MTKRQSATSLVGIRAGCEGCASIWDVRNAKMLAARHHDRTRHRTWVEETTRTEFGGNKPSGSRAEARLL